MQPTNEETRNFEEPKKSNTKMKLTFTSPTADSADFTLEERKAAFMNNEELMREATKYVTEIVEKAKIEAAKREQNSQTNGGDANGKGNDKMKNDNSIAGWNNRARGFCNRVMNVVFPCFNNNGKSYKTNAKAN